jgi:hypothetical protein
MSMKNSLRFKQRLSFHAYISSYVPNEYFSDRKNIEMKFILTLEDEDDDAICAVLCFNQFHMLVFPKWELNIKKHSIKSIRFHFTLPEHTYEIITIHITCQFTTPTDTTHDNYQSTQWRWIIEFTKRRPKIRVFLIMFYFLLL